jgi:aspartate racemase
MRSLTLIECAAELPRQAAIPGIIGGVGPLAHIAFERRLIAESARRGATSDRGHPVWILVNASDIPDRTACLSSGSDECVRHLVRYGRMLETAGADFLVVACNTAHAFHRPVQAALSIPWIHLIDATAAAIARCHPGIERVGVLATDGTVGAGLYHQSLFGLGIAVVSPPVGSDLQTSVMDAIYAPGWGIKARGLDITARAKAAVSQAMHWLHGEGAQLVVAGCTELSAALETLSHESSLPLPWIDPLEIAAHLTLDLAFGAADVYPGAIARAPNRATPRKAFR